MMTFNPAFASGLIPELTSLDENMANLVEDALQATPQSRTKPVDKQK